MKTQKESDSLSENMKTFVLYFLSLLGLVRCGLFDNVEDEEVEGLLARPCLPLPECEPLMYMIRNKDSIPGLSREDVFRLEIDAKLLLHG